MQPLFEQIQNYKSLLYAFKLNIKVFKVDI